MDCIYLTQCAYVYACSYIGIELVATVMDPSLLIAQIIFSSLWFLMLVGYIWDVVFLIKEKRLSNAKRFRLHIAALGSVMAVIEIIYWTVHSGLFLFFSFKPSKNFLCFVWNASNKEKSPIKMILIYIL